jgi:hypothetical protein
MFKQMVRRELFGSICACGFPIDTYIDIIVVSVDGEVKVVYEIIFFC